MKKKNFILTFVFFLLAIIYIIRSFLNNGITKETLYRGTIEDSVNTKGMVVKYEGLYSPDVPGVLDSKFSSGERVSSGSLIAVTYKGTIDPDIKNRLEQVNRKIAIIENNQNKNSTFSNDISKLEQEINSAVSDIISYSYDKNMENVALLKYNLTALAEHKAAVEGNTEARSQTLDALRQTKADLETQIGVAQSSIYAQSAGIFSSYIDGLEQLITPFNMHELTTQKFDELYKFEEENIKNNTQNNNTYVCKIIDNFRYFVAFKADEKKAADLKPGDIAKLRFYDISAQAVEAKVFHISPAEDGQNIIIVECNDYQDGLLEKRFVNIDFIKNTYSGYRVSLSALHTKDGTNGIYVIRENVLRFIPVNILHNQNDVLIVSSADSDNPLKLYDEVVINAPSFQEGQIID